MGRIVIDGWELAASDQEPLSEISLSWLCSLSSYEVIALMAVSVPVSGLNNSTLLLTFRPGRADDKPQENLAEARLGMFTKTNGVTPR